MTERPRVPLHPTADLAPALERMADALAWPLMLVDEQGYLHHANRTAHELLAVGHPLRLDDQRRLQPAALSYRADLQLALHEAARGLTRELSWPGRPGGSRGTLRPLARLPDGTPLLLLDLQPAPASPADGK